MSRHYLMRIVMQITKTVFTLHIPRRDQWLTHWSPIFNACITWLSWSFLFRTMFLKSFAIPHKPSLLFTSDLCCYPVLELLTNDSRCLLKLFLIKFFFCFKVMIKCIFWLIFESWGISDVILDATLYLRRGGTQHHYILIMNVTLLLKGLSWLTTYIN